MPPSVPVPRAPSFDPASAAAVLRHCGALAERAGDPVLAYLIALAIAGTEEIARDQPRAPRASG